MEVWFRWFSFSMRWFSSSMLIFRGVTCIWTTKKLLKPKSFTGWSPTKWPPQLLKFEPWKTTQKTLSFGGFSTSTKILRKIITPVDTQNSHVWKEIHLKNTSFLVSMLDFGGVDLVFDFWETAPSCFQPDKITQIEVPDEPKIGTESAWA